LSHVLKARRRIGGRSVLGSREVYATGPSLDRQPLRRVSGPTRRLSTLTGMARQVRRTDAGGNAPSPSEERDRPTTPPE